MPNSLLPPNSTALERQVEAVTARIGELPTPLADLWNPWRCPAKLLPWLAWSLSVENWGSDWPEQVQRQVIADSVAVHRLKGTVGAVRRAIGALGASIELVEWWENGGEPHTAELVAYAGKNLDPSGNTVLTAELQRTLWQVVEATKPVRSHINFRVGVALGAGVKLAAGAAAKIYSRQQYRCRLPEEKLDTAAAVGGAAGCVVVGRRPGKLSARQGIAARAHLVGAVGGLVVNRNTMGVS